jgi:hypothetical protein
VKRSQVLVTKNHCGLPKRYTQVKIHFIRRFAAHILNISQMAKRDMQRNTLNEERIQRVLFRIARRRYICMFLCFGLLPTFFLASSFLPATIAQWVGILWFIAVSISLFVNGFSKCPRCGKLFHASPKWGPLAGNQLSKECLHCHLPLSKKLTVH